MPGQHKIRWRESDLQELRRTVRNYNAKIARQREKLLNNEQRYQAANLPKKASVKDLRQNIGSRSDFKKELAQMQNFIKTGDKFMLGKRRTSSLEKTVDQFNAKVDRLIAAAKKKSANAPTAWIPKPITVEGMKQIAKTPADLDRMIQDYKGFLKRGAEEIYHLPDTQNDVKLTKWQYDLMNEGVDEVNRYRAKEREAWQNTEMKYGGKPLGYTRAQVGMDLEGSIPNMSLYTRSSTERDMHKKLELIMRERQAGYWDARTELARINYIETLNAFLGNDPVGKILVKQVSKLPLEDFKRTLLESHDMFDLLYAMKEEGDPHARESILQQVWNEWNPGKDMWEAVDEYVEREANKL